MGLTHSDHFQPGSKTARPNVTSPRAMASRWPLSNVRTSSALSMFFFRNELMLPPLAVRFVGDSSTARGLPSTLGRYIQGDRGRTVGRSGLMPECVGRGAVREG